MYSVHYIPVHIAKIDKIAIMEGARNISFDLGLCPKLSVSGGLRVLNILLEIQILWHNFFFMKFWGNTVNLPESLKSMGWGLLFGTKLKTNDFFWYLS